MKPLLFSIIIVMSNKKYFRVIKENPHFIVGGVIATEDSHPERVKAINEVFNLTSRGGAFLELAVVVESPDFFEPVYLSPTGTETYITKDQFISNLSSIVG